MLRSHRYRRVAVVSGILVLLILGLFGTIQYLNVEGFKRTLSNLVSTGTNGAYTLEIGSTRIDHLNTCFSLREIEIIRHDSADHGIKKIVIPELTVDVGPLVAMISSRQFKINEFKVVEPIARVGIQEPSIQTSAMANEHISIAQQIARFWPAVRTILEYFDITNFRIERAGLGLVESQETTIDIRLLDLLISNWNLRDIPDEAQFKLLLAGQTIELPGTDVTFESVVFDYHRNELDILDFLFTKKDTLGREMIRFSGAALRLVNLNYEQLVSNERYVLDQMHVEEPKIETHIYPHKKSTERNLHPVSDLLKSSLGNLVIREGEIVDAAMDLTIYQPNDTLFVHLPKLNLITSGFQVNEDSSTILIDELMVNIQETSLNLNDALRLQFTNLLYDEDYNVIVDSLELVDNQTGQPVLQWEQISLFNFHFFRSFYDQDLRMDSVLFRNGAINYTAGFSLPGFQMKGQTNSQTSSLQAHLGKVHIDNFDLSYEENGQSIKLTGLYGTIHNLVKESQLNYDLGHLACPNIEFHDSRQHTQLKLQDLFMTPGLISIHDAQATHQNLRANITNLRAEPTGFSINQPVAPRWNRINIDAITLSGSLPKQGNSDATENLVINEATIGSLATDLDMSETESISGWLKDIELVNLKSKGSTHTFDMLDASVVRLLLQKDDNKVTLGASRVRSDSTSILRDLDLILKEEVRMASREIILGPWSYDSSGIDLESMNIKNIQLADMTNNRLSTVDSVALVSLELSLGSSPRVDEVLVYGPQLSLASPGRQELQEHDSPAEKEPLKQPMQPLKMFNRLQVYPGKLSVDSQNVTFEKVDFTWEDGQPLIDLRAVALKTQTNSLHVGRIWSEGSSLYIDSVYLIPVPEYVENISAETDLIAAQLNHVELVKVNWDSLLEGNVLHCEEMVLDGIDLSIKRDKTLPDPPYITKPYLLSEFIPVPDRMHLPKITGRNGRVVYIEIGEKTGQEGHLAIENIEFVMNRSNPIHEPEAVSSGSGLVYNHGPISYEYHRLDSGKFSLNVRLTDMPVLLLNQMVDPLEAASFKSGHLHEFEVNMVGDSIQTWGQGSISYDDLHVEVYKTHTPDVKNFGSELLTLIIDKIILKHSKSDASADFVQPRIPSKGPINYWVKSGIHAASAAVIKGKEDDKKRKKKKKSK